MTKTAPADVTADKQQRFNAAMTRYNTGAGYLRFSLAVSIANCLLQLLLLITVFGQSIGMLRQAVSVVAAYLLADLLNGLVHLYMDNNDNYEGSAGPLVASFHLHHKRPVYRKRNIFAVYFTETGSKVWLLPYQGLVLALLLAGILSGVPAYILVYTAVLSSVAEVSHYLCHVDHGPGPGLLRKAGLLLDKRYHARHHLNDNMQYTFLNGMTDPLVNLIARRFYPGYKQFTDLHYGAYTGPQTENR